MKQSQSAIEISLRGRVVVTYQIGPGELVAGVPEAFRRGGYLHPLVTPKGQVVSADYPANHRHHHGIWTAWTKTEFAGRTPDFWNMGEQKGRVEFAELVHTRTTPDLAEIRSRHRFVDLTGTTPMTILDEEWVVRVWATPPATPHLVDLDFVHKNVTDHTLHLPRYHYGGLGFRGLDSWDGGENCQFLTSEGTTNRISGNETRARWCWIGGAVPEGVAGLAIMGHRDNFRAPEPIRVHPSEPFLSFAPQQLGEFVILPGGTHKARYRILIADGPPDPVELNRRWKEWVEEPN